jgi:hypothetical protein
MCEVDVYQAEVFKTESVDQKLSEICPRCRSLEGYMRRSVVRKYSTWHPGCITPRAHYVWVARAQNPSGRGDQ